MPCGEDGKDEVHALWFASEGAVKPAKLDGSLTGDARAKYWAEQKEFRLATAAAEGDHADAKAHSEGAAPAADTATA